MPLGVSKRSKDGSKIFQNEATDAFADTFKEPNRTSTLSAPVWLENDSRPAVIDTVDELLTRSLKSE
jgi:hypothetical protein